MNPEIKGPFFRPSIPAKTNPPIQDVATQWTPNVVLIASIIVGILLMLLVTALWCTKYTPNDGEEDWDMEKETEMEEG